MSMILQQERYQITGKVENNIKLKRATICPFNIDEINQNFKL